MPATNKLALRLTYSFPLGLRTTAAFTKFWIADKFHLSLPKLRKGERTVACNFMKPHTAHNKSWK